MPYSDYADLQFLDEATGAIVRAACRYYDATMALHDAERAQRKVQAEDASVFALAESDGEYDRRRGLAIKAAGEVLEAVHVFKTGKLPGGDEVKS